MTVLVPIMMFAWPLAVVLFFCFLPPRRAVLASLLGAWLFLPVYTFEVAGLPDYSKTFVTCVWPLAVAFVFDTRSILKVRPHLQDLPMLVWCICPLFTSLDNDLGFYDGLSAVLDQAVAWGIPYFLGRTYFSDREGMKELALGIFWAGMVYVPFCLYEVRMSPQLHGHIYGYYQHDFLQTLRLGGYRPMVFMQHGLMLGLWMCCASLVGVWLVRTRVLAPFMGVPAIFLLVLLLVTTVLCKSAGALVLLFLAIVVLFVSVNAKASWPLLLLMCIPLLYMGLRMTGFWEGKGLVKAVARVNELRADSLKFRFDNETILLKKSYQRPIFGWGGYGRSRVYATELDEKDRRGGVWIDPDRRRGWLLQLAADSPALQRLFFGVRRPVYVSDETENVQDVSVTDGLWIIALGQYGLVGLVAVMASLLLPLALVVNYSPPWEWTDPNRFGAILLAVMLAIYVVDSLLNAMINPVFAIIAGALAGLPILIRLEGEQGGTAEEAEDGDHGRMPTTRMI